MIVLAHGSGAWDFDVLGRVGAPETWQQLKSTALQLLRNRLQSEAADALDSLPFDLFHGTNTFNDDFFVLRATLPLERYVELSAAKAKGSGESRYRAVQAVFQELGYYVRFIVAEVAMNNAPAVSAPVLDVSSQAVERSLRDAEQLLSSSGASSAVDRLHTAFHGYLIALCARAGISLAPKTSTTKLFKLLRSQHPSLAAGLPAQSESARIVNALATIVDALNPIRNDSSLAHPNPSLLTDAEAMLVINTVRTLFHFLNALAQPLDAA